MFRISQLKSLPIRTLLRQPITQRSLAGSASFAVKPSSKTGVLTETERLIMQEYKYGAHNYMPIPGRSFFTDFRPGFWHLLFLSVVVLSKGKGVFVWDVEGNQYYDFMGAYAAVNQGHCHPKIIATLIQQAGNTCTTSSHAHFFFFRQAQVITLTSRAFHNDALGEFVKFATEFFGYDRMLPMNTVCLSLIMHHFFWSFGIIGSWGLGNSMQAFSTMGIWCERNSWKSSTPYFCSW